MTDTDGFMKRAANRGVPAYLKLVQILEGLLPLFDLSPPLPGADLLEGRHGQTL